MGRGVLFTEQMRENLGFKRSHEGHPLVKQLIRILDFILVLLRLLKKRTYHVVSLHCPKHCTYSLPTQTPSLAVTGSQLAKFAYSVVAYVSMI